MSTYGISTLTPHVEAGAAAVRDLPCRQRCTTAGEDYGRPRSGMPRRTDCTRQGGETMLTILLIIVVLLLLFGGGWGYSRRGRV
jgi:hypothetical protein